MNSSHRLHDPSIDNSCWSAKSLAVITIAFALIVAMVAGRTDGQETPTWPHLDLGNAKVVDGFVKMPPESRIQTKETFTGPIEIVVVAKTEKNNIRLNAFNGAAVLFNWEVNPGALRVNRPDGNDNRESGSVAMKKVKPLDANKWHTLRWLITRQGMSVSVNGKVVFSERRAYDLSAERPAFIQSADSLIDVKSFVVTRLEPKKEVAQKPEKPSNTDGHLNKRPDPVLLDGHTKDITCIAFSPNGKVVATASQDETVKLWEVVTGKELTTLKGFTIPVECIAFSPDGKLLTTSALDITLWSAETWKESHAFSEKTQKIGSPVAFHSNGNTLAVTTNDGGIKLWNLSTRKGVNLSEKYPSDITSIAVAPKGQRFAAGFRDGSVKFWDLDVLNGGVQTLVKKNTRSVGVQNLAFTSDGNQLVVNDLATGVRVYDVSDDPDRSKLLRPADGGPEEKFAISGLVFSFAMSADGNTAAVGEHKGVSLWDTKGWKKLATVSKSSTDADVWFGRIVALSPNGRTLATANHKEKSVKLWKIDVDSTAKLGLEDPKKSADPMIPKAVQGAEERIAGLLKDPVYGELNQRIYKILKGNTMPGKIEQDIRQCNILAAKAGYSSAKAIELLQASQEQLRKQGLPDALAVNITISAIAYDIAQKQLNGK